MIVLMPGIQTLSFSLKESAWKALFRPKEEGLHTARDTNLAFMLKLCWRMLKCPTLLWVRVLGGQYVSHFLDEGVCWKW